MSSFIIFTRIESKYR